MRDTTKRELFYDFATHYCDATWQTGAGNLFGCNAKSLLLSEEPGFVVYLDNPALENRHENEPGPLVERGHCFAEGGTVCA